MIPVAAASMIQAIYRETTEGQERSPYEESRGPGPNGWYISRDRGPRTRPIPWKGWTVTAVIALLIALFFAGTFGFHMVVIEDDSMTPAYERGDLAVVREGVDLVLLREGDVIVFELRGRPAARRIVAIGGQPGGMVFTTQGDNIDDPEVPIHESRIDGKVVLLVPEVGHINLWLRGG